MNPQQMLALYALGGFLAYSLLYALLDWATGWVDMHVAAAMNRPLSFVEERGR